MGAPLGNRNAAGGRGGTPKRGRKAMSRYKKSWKFIQSSHKLNKPKTRGGHIIKSHGMF